METAGSEDISEISKMLDEAAAASLTSSKQATMEDPAIAKMREDIESGVSSRTALGITFGRANDGGKDPLYKTLKSNSEKRQFREEWAAKRLDQLTQKVRTTTLSQEQRDHGEYLPFDVIVDREGGAHRPQAVQAAKNYVKKCLAMSNAWLQFNHMTGRYAFLYIRKQYIETFNKSWQTYQDPNFQIEQPDQGLNI